MCTIHAGDSLLIGRRKLLLTAALTSIGSTPEKIVSNACFADSSLVFDALLNEGIPVNIPTVITPDIKAAHNFFSFILIPPFKYHFLSAGLTIGFRILHKLLVQDAAFTPFLYGKGKIVPEIFTSCFYASVMPALIVIVLFHILNPQK